VFVDVGTAVAVFVGDGMFVTVEVLVEVGTDVGVFVATVGSTTWSRLGSGLPNSSVNDLSVTPTGAVLAATHGRGIWQITVPAS